MHVESHQKRETVFDTSMQ